MTAGRRPGRDVGDTVGGGRRPCPAVYELNFSSEPGAGVFLWCYDPEDEQRWGGNPIDPTGRRAAVLPAGALAPSAVDRRVLERDLGAGPAGFTRADPLGSQPIVPRWRPREGREEAMTRDRTATEGHKRGHASPSEGYGKE